MGVAAAALVTELVLRVANPIPLRLRGVDIDLPTNTRTVAHNLDSDRIGGEIVVTRNSLGFRGPEPPEDFDAALTLIAIGGSTTEDRYLTDGETWTDQLGARLGNAFAHVWLDNAGLDGHSTFGHLHLLEQVVGALHPDYALYLIGINDVDRDDANSFDLKTRSVRRSLWQSIVSKSVLLSTLAVVRRSLRVRDLGVGHKLELNLRRVKTTIDDVEAVEAYERRQRDRCLPLFVERLEFLIERTRAFGIEPVLLTQPALFGDGVDPTTGIFLGNLKNGDKSAAVRWRVLESYNDVTRRVGRERGVFVIDLAHALSKDSRLFYDWIHFSRAGATRVAEIVESQLVPYLRERHAELALVR